MTVVIGAVRGNSVWLAGDSYCGDDNVVELCESPKVLKVSNTVGLGLCGDVRTEIVVTQAIKGILAKKTKISEAWLRHEFSNQLHEILKDKGVLKDSKGIHSLEDSDYILAHAGRLYYLDSTLALWSPREPYLAIGVGREMALAALAYAHDSGELEDDPADTLDRVMRVVSKHNHHVRPPYTVLKV